MLYFTMKVYRETYEIVATIPISVFVYTPNVANPFGDNLAAPILPNGFSLNGTSIDISTLDSSVVSFGSPYDDNGDSIVSTFKVEPETSEFKFVESSGDLVLNMANLLSQALESGEVLKYSIEIQLIDDNVIPRTNLYGMEIVV